MPKLNLFLFSLDLNYRDSTVPNNNEKHHLIWVTIDDNNTVVY